MKMTVAKLPVVPLVLCVIVLSATMTLADLLSCPCKAPKQMHLATTKADKALRGILQDPALSDSSKHTYAQRLKAMSAKQGRPMTELIPMDTRAIPRTCNEKEPGYSSVGCSQTYASNEQQMPGGPSSMATGFQRA